MRVLVAIAVLSIGCSKKEQAKPVEQPPPRPADPAPKPAEPAPKPAEPARTGSVDELAARIGAKVVARGAAELDDKPGPDRWAQLDGGEHGQYVIETSGKVFLAQYEADGRTQPWPGDPAGKAIAHQQGHRAGYQRWELAVRGGELVVLREESVDDARAGDAPVKKDYGDCVPSCPKAGERGFTVSSGPTLADVGTMGR
ncbi:MAG: hypothetical protein JNL83_39775 [Myxococcales bacterium]|nr:hypothetical protein [Myxococcales bacterium]